MSTLQTNMPPLDPARDLYAPIADLACEIERDERAIKDGLVDALERGDGERDRESGAARRSEDGLVTAGCADSRGLRGRVHGLDDLGDPCPAGDVAAALSKSPKTIIDWCQEREYTRIPCFKIGNRWYHRLPELKRWLKGIQSGQVEFRRKPRSGKGR